MPGIHPLFLSKPVPPKLTGASVQCLPVTKATGKPGSTGPHFVFSCPSKPAADVTRAHHKACQQPLVSVMHGCYLYRDCSTRVCDLAACSIARPHSRSCIRRGITLFLLWLKVEPLQALLTLTKWVSENLYNKLRNQPELQDFRLVIQGTNPRWCVLKDPSVQLLSRDSCVMTKSELLRYCHRGRNIRPCGHLRHHSQSWFSLQTAVHPPAVGEGHAGSSPFPEAFGNWPGGEEAWEFH